MTPDETPAITAEQARRAAVFSRKLNQTLKYTTPYFWDDGRAADIDAAFRAVAAALGYTLTRNSQ